MKNLSLLFIAILFLHNATFPQLDSGYYLGPSVGSVSSGAMQNTDNFPDKLTIVPQGKFRYKPPYEISNVIKRAKA